jgi:hypothetical protein
MRVNAKTPSAKTSNATKPKPNPALRAIFICLNITTTSRDYGI